MIWRIAISGALVGLLVGAAGALVAGGTSTSTEQLWARGAPASNGPAPCADASRLARDVERLRAELELLERTIRVFAAEEVAIIGAPFIFPDDLAPSYQPSRARDTVEAALVGKPYIVDAVDCDEFPCLALVSKAPAAADQQGSRTTVGATVALEEAGLEIELRGLGWRPTGTEIGGRQTSYEWIALTGGTPLTNEWKRRMEYRIALLNEFAAAP